jgi:threonylcarbamoyladenosine tRNA methylthiotransferase MtaB
MTVAFYTLGCKVNTYETEFLMNEFTKRNYEIVPFKDKADIYVINTCTVTNTSDAKSRKIIHRVVREHKGAVIVVMGCFIQLKYKELEQNKDISIIIGNKDKSKVVDYVEAYLKNRERIIKIYDLRKQTFESMEINSFLGRTRAFVKIQDGCNNFCSYCVIPYVRGNVRSKPMEDVIREITNLVNNGYIEIVLTGIHTGNYGRDLGNISLTTLLKEIIKIDGLKRVRISSIEITELNDDILEVLKDSKVIADHLHVPLQAGSNKILKLMNRKYDTNYFMDKINIIRSIRPDISITTDIIVGFPQETEEDFMDTYNFAKKIEFSKIHVFPYSKRDNTVAAKLEGHVDEVTKKDRVNRLIQLSECLEKKYMNKFIGKEVEAIFETYKDDYYMGHSSNYLEVKIKSDEDIKGKIVKIEITDIAYPYVLGKVIK